MKFRKKPIEVEAFHFVSESQEPWPEWLMDAHAAGSLYREMNGTLKVRTLEGIMNISEGDWVIKGVGNEIYPCKPDIFARSYEEMPEYLSEELMNKAEKRIKKRDREEGAVRRNNPINSESVKHGPSVF